MSGKETTVVLIKIYNLGKEKINREFIKVMTDFIRFKLGKMD